MKKRTSPSSELQQPYFIEDNTISVSDIILIIARNLKIILIIPSILCLTTIIYSIFIAKPVFTSTSKIMSSSGGGASQAANLAAQFGINIPTGQSETKWVYPEIIKSRTLARAVLKQKFDTYKFGPDKSLLQILTFGNRKPKSSPSILEINGVNSLLGMIRVSEDVKTGILTLQIDASEPVLASEINRVFDQKA